MGSELTIFRKTQFPFPLQFIIFSTVELQLQFPFQFVSCNSGHQLTEWGQLLISELTIENFVVFETALDSYLDAQ